MATLILMRHAAAEAAAPGMRDFDRPLSEAGRAEAVAAAARMRASGLRAELVLHSPALRTTTTAALVAAGLGLDATRLRALPPLYNASAAVLEAAAIEAARGLAPGATLMLVAHNPGISECAALLEGAGAERVSMATAEFRCRALRAPLRSAPR